MSRLAPSRVEVPCTPENLKEIFTSSQEGRILFDKIKIASMDDAMFAVSDTDTKNF
jgi:hypothetical protein